MKDIKYYRYMGFIDSSGRPHGYIIKCYTKAKYEYYSKTFLFFPISE